METNFKKISEDILESTDIINILSVFGEVNIVGSLAFDLMTEPDIDIIVTTNNPQKSSEDAVAHISKLHLFQKIEYGDFDKFPRENRPPFYIFNMKIPWEGQLFEIETWFLPEAKDQLDFVEKMKNITEEQRQQILELKLKRKEDGVGKKSLSSFDIYNQILG